MAAVGLLEKLYPFGDKINSLCPIVISFFFKYGSSKKLPLSWFHFSSGLLRPQRGFCGTGGWTGFSRHRGYLRRCIDEEDVKLGYLKGKSKGRVKKLTGCSEGLREAVRLRKERDNMSKQAGVRSVDHDRIEALIAS